MTNIWIGQSQTISVGLTGKMDDSQPVDLAGVKKANLVPGVAPLKIPAVPQRPLPPRPTVWVFNHYAVGARIPSVFNIQMVHMIVN